MSLPEGDIDTNQPDDGKSSSAIKWKNPSVAHLQRFDLVPLPETFVPTVEEQMLLNMYDTLARYERQAARLKEEAARAKLAARDAEFQQKIMNSNPKKIKRKKLKKEKKASADADHDEDDDEDEKVSNGDEDVEEDDEDDDEDDDLHERREAKLAALREEIQKASQKDKKLEQDALRETLLQEQADFDDAPTLKRKRLAAEDVEPASLIANLAATSTPPHDFSSKLGFTAAKGVVLFPQPGDGTRWAPPEGVSTPNDLAFTAELEAFDVSRAQNGQGNNTLAIKFMAPSESKRFSINIAEEDNDDFDSVLFHFNPRQFERGGQLIVNDKQEGVWGQAVAVPLSQVPLMFGQQSCTLVVQINGEGFDIFVNEKHCCRLEHRKELPTTNTKLVLQFPSTDDYGNPEDWSVYKVWWGNRPIMAKADVSGIAGVNSYSSHHPRKLFISSLSKIFAEAEVELRRAELERAFRKYGGDRGVQVIVPTNSTYAFVEMESERQADLALNEMQSQYRLNRARRSRHEALQEERAAKEAAKLAAPSGGIATKKEGAGWD